MTQSSSTTDTSQQQNSTYGNQNQSSANPWLPSSVEMLNLLKTIPGMNPGIIPAQTEAGTNLYKAGMNLPNFGGAAANVTGGLLGGDPTGLLKQSNTTFQQQLAPIANAPLDPTQNPEIQKALQAAQYNATQQNNAIFSGAGRTGGGAQSYALGQGIANAEAPMLLGQYNQDVQNTINAGSQMFGANYGTANAITGNQQAGLGAAAMQPGIQMAPALQQLQNAQTAYNLPLSNLAGVEGITLPLAGMGGFNTGNNSGTAAASGTGTSNTVGTPSILQDIGMLGGILGGNSGLFGGATPALGNLFKGIGV